MHLIKNVTSLESPENLRAFILETYGIDANVKMMDGKPSIKVDHHISLGTLINKIKDDFSFYVFHPVGTNEYLIKIV